MNYTKKQAMHELTVATVYKGGNFELRCDGIEVGRVLLLSNDESPRMSIWSLEVYPEYQGLGHGRKMMQLIESTARTAGKKTLWLRVDKSNERAIKLYLSHGFVVCSERASDFSMEKQL